QETVGGAGLRFYVSDKPTMLFALQGGVIVRGGDAFSPHIGAIWNQWRVAVNFDSNFSQFKNASNRLGGPEIHVTYIFSKVPAGNYCPICPTFL
ncbi:MAG: hypothetical protein HC817_04800, partial [Saprospiraceae bacterium]|nr:hypothetical protein [Saprospiraceae bacterium]